MSTKNIYVLTFIATGVILIGGVGVFLFITKMAQKQPPEISEQDHRQETQRQQMEARVRQGEAIDPLGGSSLPGTTEGSPPSGGSSPTENSPSSESTDIPSSNPPETGAIAPLSGAADEGSGAGTAGPIAPLSSGADE